MCKTALYNFQNFRVKMHKFRAPFPTRFYSYDRLSQVLSSIDSEYRKAQRMASAFSVFERYHKNGDELPTHTVLVNLRFGWLVSLPFQLHIERMRIDVLQITASDHSVVIGPAATVILAHRTASYCVRDVVEQRTDSSVVSAGARLLCYGSD